MQQLGSVKGAQQGTGNLGRGHPAKEGAKGLQLCFLDTHFPPLLPYPTARGSLRMVWAQHW